MTGLSLSDQHLAAAFFGRDNSEPEHYEGLIAPYEDNHSQSVEVEEYQEEDQLQGYPRVEVCYQNDHQLLVNITLRGMEEEDREDRRVKKEERQDGIEDCFSLEELMGSKESIEEVSKEDSGAYDTCEQSEAVYQEEEGGAGAWDSPEVLELVERYQKSMQRAELLISQNSNGDDGPRINTLPEGSELETTNVSVDMLSSSSSSSSCFDLHEQTRQAFLNKSEASIDTELSRAGIEACEEYWMAQSPLNAFESMESCDEIDEEQVAGESHGEPASDVPVRRLKRAHSSAFSVPDENKKAKYSETSQE